MQESLLRAYKQLSNSTNAPVSAHGSTGLRNVADLVRSRKRRNEHGTPEDRKWKIRAIAAFARPHA